MKLTTGILAITITMVAGSAFTTQAVAQNPDAIDNARSIAKSLQQKQQIESDKSLDPATKPAPGAPAPAVKPAVIPGSSSAAKAGAPMPAAMKLAATPKAVSPAATASSPHNQLQKVNVVADGDGFRIELITNQAVAGKVSKLNSPARVLVELPETIAATRENRITVGSGGIKGIRIGTDGKNPPTTSVVAKKRGLGRFPA